MAEAVVEDLLIDAGCLGQAGAIYVAFAKQFAESVTDIQNTIPPK